jgi:hypothetical protein
MLYTKEPILHARLSTKSVVETLARCWNDPHTLHCPIARGQSSSRSYWIPGSYAPALSEKRSSFLRLLKDKGFKEESMTKARLYTIGTHKTLESNKSPDGNMLWHAP